VLPGVSRLLHCRLRFSFNRECIEIFGKEGNNCLGKRPHNLSFQVQPIEHGERSILKDRVRVQNEHPDFHGSRNIVITMEAGSLPL
jgi:hypothetical protein